MLDAIKTQVETRHRHALDDLLDEVSEAAGHLRERVAYRGSRTPDLVDRIHAADAVRRVFDGAESHGSLEACVQRRRGRMNGSLKSWASLISCLQRRGQANWQHREVHEDGPRGLAEGCGEETVAQLTAEHEEDARDQEAGAHVRDNAQPASDSTRASFAERLDRPRSRQYDLGRASSRSASSIFASDWEVTKPLRRRPAQLFLRVQDRVRKYFQDFQDFEAPKGMAASSLEEALEVAQAAAQVYLTVVQAALGDTGAQARHREWDELLHVDSGGSRPSDLQKAWEAVMTCAVELVVANGGDPSELPFLGHDRENEVGQEDGIVDFNFEGEADPRAQFELRGIGSPAASERGDNATAKLFAHSKKLRKLDMALIEESLDGKILLLRLDLTMNDHVKTGRDWTDKRLYFEVSCVYGLPLGLPLEKPGD
ncbi:hypothetical protein PHYPSEUDO_013681 [Phytophthora pseudosyringae]|uniref:Uncharacterized protein n=1 Tax=Phytophthora pseudosyringae TaxID=221518 RepID=A0A8T1W1N0_9STRA|nr:hypothetical protein PHYPSEUDO_013681 [Phytophthora pseudosyringae]